MVEPGKTLPKLILCEQGVLEAFSSAKQTFEMSLQSYILERVVGGVQPTPHHTSMTFKASS